MLSTRNRTLTFSLIFHKRIYLEIPKDITIKFNPILIHKRIPKNEHHNFRKWLRYYFDFCKKYHFPESKQQSLPHFIKKLQEKQQSSNQQKQAAFAISLYYSIARSDTENNLPESKNSLEKAQPSPIQKQSLSPTPNNPVESTLGSVNSKRVLLL